MTQSYDIAIVGGGPGGYTAALRACGLGLSVALIEMETVGGVCLNRGCIPTKTLLSDVEGIGWTRRTFDQGIIDRVPEVSFPGMMRRKDEVVHGIVTNLAKLLSSSGVHLLNNRATLREPGSLELGNGETLNARHTIIATGSRSWTPPIPGADLPGVLDTRRVLQLEALPDSIVIIGGGIIGQEFAAIFSMLGTQVTVLEALDTILLEVDKEISKRYAGLVRGRMNTEVGVQIHRIEDAGDRLRVVYERKGKEKTVQADRILMATGRRPYFKDLGEEDVGIEIENRAIKVDDFLQTNAEGIYAVGDVLGRKMLAHVAAFHGELVAENIAGRHKPVRDRFVPSCVFTIPQIAWVGLTQEQAIAEGRSFRTSIFQLTASGKAQAMGEPRGWIKLIEDSQTRALIGAHLIGPHVSELLGELTLAIRKGMTASDIADTIHPHPTLSEAVREAALGLLDGAIHAPARTKEF